MLRETSACCSNNESCNNAMTSGATVADPGVLGLRAVVPSKSVVAADSAPPVRDREEFTKRPVESNEAYAEYLHRARTSALDPLRLPKIVFKTVLGAMLAVKLIQKVLLAIFPSDAQVVNKAIRALAFAGFLYKVKAASKTNPQLKSGASTLPIIGSLPTVLSNFTNFHGLMLDIARNAEFESTEVTLPGVHMFLAMDAQDREFILRSHFSNFTKNLNGEDNSFEYGFAELFGRGIFAVDGAEWKDHRKIASHLFSGNSLKLKMEKVFNHHGEILKDVLQKHAERNETIDLQNHMQASVFDAFCEIAFGISPGAFDLAVEGKKHEFLQSFDCVQTFTAQRLFLPPPVWALMRFFRVGQENEIRKHIKVMRDYIMPIVRARKASALSNTQHETQDDKDRDMLSLYIAHARELNETYMLDDEYLYDVVANFMVAGRDTTSCSLTNFFLFLSTNGNAEATLLQELQQKLQTGESMTLELTRDLNFTSSCVNETIRLLPPVSDDLRICNEDVVLPSGLKVLRGTQVHIPNYAIGRDPSLWHEPDQFLPERWMINANKPGGIRRPDEYVLPAFWGGPRLCLGHAMARFEMITFIAKVCPTLKLTPLEGQSYTLMSGPVAFYRDGIQVKVETRS